MSDQGIGRQKSSSGRALIRTQALACQAGPWGPQSMDIPCCGVVGPLCVDQKEDIPHHHWIQVLDSRRLIRGPFSGISELELNDNDPSDHSKARSAETQGCTRDIRCLKG